MEKGFEGISRPPRPGKSAALPSTHQPPSWGLSSSPETTDTDSFPDGNHQNQQWWVIYQQGLRSGLEDELHQNIWLTRHLGE